MAEPLRFPGTTLTFAGWPVRGRTLIRKGDILFITKRGNVYPASPGDNHLVVGVAESDEDNRKGKAGDKKVQIRQEFTVIYKDAITERLLS